MERLISNYVITGTLTLLAATAAPAEQRNPVWSGETAAQQRETLRLMTLNIAHGRGTSPHQLLTTASRHRRNLDRVAAVVERHQPHLLALQEADGECSWSGGFDHVRYLQQAGNFDQIARNDLVTSQRLQHGVALLSQFPLQQTHTLRFDAAPITTPKGLVLATIAWPGHPALQIDVVSVHLEAFRAGVRDNQVTQMIDFLARRDNPLIIMGDMNTGWNGRGQVLSRLAGALGLEAHRPQSREHISLPMLRRRIDWIFISGELEFIGYETLAESISDHRAVIAEVALRQDANRVAQIASDAQQ